jgi:MSHA biogenesis protein MshL
MKKTLILLVMILLFNFKAYGATREMAYDGKEIDLTVKIGEQATVIFPEPIIREIHSDQGSDSYVIYHLDTEPKVLWVMPLGTNEEIVSVTGVSGEHYVLKCTVTDKDNFDTQLKVLPMSRTIGSNNIVTESVSPQQITKEDEVKIKNILPGVKNEPLVPLVTLTPKPAAPQPAEESVDRTQAVNSYETLPAELNLKVTLKGNNLPLKIYFSTISEVTGYNIITTPDIDSQKTSINLENIEVWRALKSLLYKFGYGFKVSQEDLIITESETRIFNISMPAVDQNFKDETSNESSSNNQSSSTSSTSGNQQAEQVNVGTKIYYENKSQNISLWTDLENNVKSMITPQIGSYSINKASGSIIVTDKPQVLDKIGDLVSTINETLGMQQSFEIQIIEVTLNNDFETGIDWNAIAKGVGGLNNITASTNFTAAGFLSGQLLSLSATGPTTTSGTSSGGVSAVLKALDSQGTVNVVSKPTITVSNLFPCILQSVTSIPYISGVGTTIGNTTSQNNVQTSEVSEGLTMRLDGKIEENKTVLNISAAENTLDSMTNVPVGGGLTIQEPQVSTKSITTNVSVEPGKSLILGGLMSSTKNNTTQGVPYLDKLPFLGRAFQYKGKIDEKTELVIIITPKKIIKNL